MNFKNFVGYYAFVNKEKSQNNAAIHQPSSFISIPFIPIPSINSFLINQLLPQLETCQMDMIRLPKLITHNTHIFYLISVTYLSRRPGNLITDHHTDQLSIVTAVGIQSYSHSVINRQMEPPKNEP